MLSVPRNFSRGPAENGDGSSPAALECRARQRISGDRACVLSPLRQSFPEPGSAAAVSAAPDDTRRRFHQAWPGADRGQYRLGRPPVAGRVACRSPRFAVDADAGAVGQRPCLISFGLAPAYPRLLLATMLLGLANAVFHPADYALLSARIAPPRVGRAFSIHTFSGFLGSAIAPVTILALAAIGGLKLAVLAAGSLALIAVLPLLLVRGVDNRPAEPVGDKPHPPSRRRPASIFTPTILGLTGFFALLSLSGSGISNFSVAALTSGFGTPATTASLALTLYLAMQALGVLAGGFIADKTRRHADVAAVGYAVNAGIVLTIGLAGLGAAPLIAAMGAAGLLAGLIMPSRDMLVRAAAPPGAMGRTFGIVTSGFNIGGMVGPLMFGFILDRGAPQWVFGASVIVMLLVAAAAFFGDRRASSRRAAAPVEAAN